MEEDVFLRRFLIITWVLVSSGIALLILGSTMYFKVKNPTAPIPEVLSNWGGIILGFYFGSFTTFAKDVILRKPRDRDQSKEAPTKRLPKADPDAEKPVAFQSVEDRIQI